MQVFNFGGRLMVKFGPLSIHPCSRQCGMRTMSSHIHPPEFVRKRGLFHKIKTMMCVARTLEFCRCPSPSCNQEDDQQVNTEQEQTQLEHELLQRLSTPNLYACMFTKCVVYEEMHKNLYAPLSPAIFVNL